MNARMNGVVAREATALADRAIDVGPARGIRLTGGVEEGGFVEKIYFAADTAASATPRVADHSFDSPERDVWPKPEE